MKQAISEKPTLPIPVVSNMADEKTIRAKTKFEGMDDQKTTIKIDEPESEEPEKISNGDTQVKNVSRTESKKKDLSEDILAFKTKPIEFWDNETIVDKIDGICKSLGPLNNLIARMDTDYNSLIDDLSKWKSRSEESEKSLEAKRSRYNIKDSHKQKILHEIRKVEKNIIDIQEKIDQEKMGAMHKRVMNITS